MGSLIEHVTERVCCHRIFCSKLFQDSSECSHCANCLNECHIEVNLEQLQQEIIRVTEVQQEQVKFYSNYGYTDGQWDSGTKVAFLADSKAIQLHLQLLQSLKTLLESSSLNMTVVIPEGIFVRSKDYDCISLVDSHGILLAYDAVEQQFFEQHKIYYHCYVPYRDILPTLRYCKSLHLGDYHGNYHGGQVIPDLATTPLEVLSIRFCQISSLIFLNPVSQTLRELDLYYCKVIDLTPLSGMRLLSKLNLSFNRISDIKPLTGLNLEELDISFNHIKDIAALANMPLVILQLSGTQVTDISPLRGMKLTKLILLNSKIRDLSPVVNIAGLKIIQDC